MKVLLDVCMCARIVSVPLSKTINSPLLFKLRATNYKTKSAYVVDHIKVNNTFRRDNTMFLILMPKLNNRRLANLILANANDRIVDHGQVAEGHPPSGINSFELLYTVTCVKHFRDRLRCS